MIYCINCIFFLNSEWKFFSNDVDLDSWAGRTLMEYSSSESSVICIAPENKTVRDTWLLRKEVYKSHPSIINRKNKCSYYQPRR